MARLTLTPNRPPKLSVEDATRLDALTDEQITAAALSDPDNLPLTAAELDKVQSARAVREARLATDLSQAAFARAYHFTPGRLRDLEQGRTRMDSAIRAYLTLIQADPEFVREKLEQAG